MDPEFLAKLICPRTRQPLREAETAELETLNAAIAAGSVTNRGGRPVTSSLDGALIPESEPVAYPVVDGIPVLLVDEAIPLGGGGGDAAGDAGEAPR